MTSTPTLAGKRALVTGGSRGIGAAIVRRLASQGSHRALNVDTNDGTPRIVGRNNMSRPDLTSP